VKHPLLRILSLAIVLTASMRAAADQGGPASCVHELPAFVQERIELTPGTVGGSAPSSEWDLAGLGTRDVDRAQPVGGPAHLVVPQPLSSLP